LAQLAAIASRLESVVDVLIHQREQVHYGRPVGGDSDRTPQIDHFEQTSRRD
jgi:hypothetical protein